MEGFEARRQASRVLEVLFVAGLVIYGAWKHREVEVLCFVFVLLNARIFSLALVCKMHPPHSSSCPLQVIYAA